MSRSEFTANQALARVAPASWTRPAPIRNTKPAPSLLQRLARAFTS